MTPQPLVIVGGGGHGSDVLGVIEALNDVERRFDVVGYVDDVQPAHPRLERRGVPYLGSPEEALSGRSASVVIAVGDPKTRAALRERLLTLAAPSPPLVHPTATISAGVRLRDGVVVLAQSSLSADVELELDAHVSQLVAVGHDTKIGRSSSVFPGAMLSGGVSLGVRVMVGSGAVLLPGCVVGDGASVGAGAVVVKDVPGDTTVVGVPGRTP